MVVVETEKGLGIGEVVALVSDQDKIKKISPKENLPKIIRRANKEDLDRIRGNLVLERDAYNFCMKRIQEIGLNMKLIRVRYFFDRTKAVFFFTAERRVDFRELVKDLARNLNTRIEMRQIGVRDESKIVGGVGSCGYRLCCNKFLHDFEPISVRMAKTQNITLNPSKISGRCGRLMCCLNYEQSTYVGLQKNLPRCGTTVHTAHCSGVVIKQNTLEQTVAIQTESGEVVAVRVDELQSPEKKPPSEGSPRKSDADRKGDQRRERSPRKGDADRKGDQRRERSPRKGDADRKGDQRRERSPHRGKGRK